MLACSPSSPSPRVLRGGQGGCICTYSHPHSHAHAHAHSPSEDMARSGCPYACYAPAAVVIDHQPCTPDAFSYPAPTSSNHRHPPAARSARRVPSPPSPRTPLPPRHLLACIAAGAAPNGFSCQCQRRPSRPVGCGYPYAACHCRGTSWSCAQNGYRTLSAPPTARPYAVS